jgi:hypothetical protein
VKIRSVHFNNRRKGFRVEIGGSAYWLPYAKLEEQPLNGDRVAKVMIDPEVGREGFVYTLTSGREGTVLSDAVLDFNDDPRYLRELLLYKLTLEAQHRVASSPLSKREIMRRMGTSAAQFYRLLDQTNIRKSVDQTLRLLAALDCYVEFSVKDAAGVRLREAD